MIRNIAIPCNNTIKVTIQMKMLIISIFLACFVLVEPYQTGCNVTPKYLRRSYYSQYFHYYSDFNLNGNSNTYYYSLNCKILSLENEHSLNASNKIVPKTNITSISFYGSTFTKLPSDILSKYTNVEKILLTYIQLQEIEQDAFKGMFKLRELELDFNNLTIIKEGTFTNLTNLEDLNLSYNNLTSSSEFKNLINLKTLNLNYNRFKNLNDLNTNSLNELYLSHNNISVLNKPINMASKGHWYYFGSIDLSFNQIENIPENIFESDFFKINLAYNNIQNISFKFVCRVLNVSHNQISTLSNFSSYLQKIDISYNKITVISSTILENSTSLEYLNVGYNNITNLHVDTFNRSSDLNTLYLHHNNISKIEVGTFHKLKNLHLLDISYNNIEIIPYGTFSGVQALEKLYLSGNKIKMLMPGSLLYLYDLRTLYIDNNYLQDFDFIFIIEHMKYLREINLDNNTITCDWLATVLHTLKRLNTVVVKGNTFKLHNINGIRCSENINVTSEITTIKATEQPVTHSAKIKITPSAVVPPIHTHSQPLISSPKSVQNNSNISQINQEQLQNIISSVSHLYVLTLIVFLLLIVFISTIILTKYRKYIFKQKHSVESIQLLDSIE